MNPKTNFEALESGFEVGHIGFRQVLKQGMAKPMTGVGRAATPDSVGVTTRPSHSPVTPDSDLGWLTNHPMAWGGPRGHPIARLPCRWPHATPKDYQISLPLFLGQISLPRSLSLGQISLPLSPPGWPTPPHMVNGGGLRRQHWCPVEARGDLNV